MKKTKILVGLSGGVDSAVVAYLLREAGYDVSCGFMINYISDTEDCPTLVDIEEARKVAEYLGLPFHTFDFREEYEKRIVNYIYEGYQKGLTPNPDILCNNLVKFDCFLKEALEYGFDKIATGHYARIEENDGIYHLLKGVDPNKDQTYFLSRLNQFQLSHALFPIGHLEKPEVREIARRAGLPNAARKDSQGLCFIGKVSMKEFLEKRLPKKPGNILDIHGNILGTHEGAFSYTIGQRKGIQVGGGPALFVIAKDIMKNTIIVGTEAELELYSSELTAIDWHWVAETRVFPFSARAKIRYRQDNQDIECVQDGENRVRVRFISPQRAITSGQMIVIYDGDELIASGIIE
ncbi:tRNA 2-thiouridine(34) synthase MnmA [Candidatus Gracilibacteria bacterium CG2_30_37_12]|nr:MAG: tRNA 2-thiouridine(34) synthase MnmA [Candidatus Gracilibacteria bacterium CG2_30_37_12]